MRIVPASRLVAAVFLVAAACSTTAAPPGSPAQDASTTAEAGPIQPTFTNVYNKVLRTSHCTETQCHGAAEQGNLGLSKAAAYKNLVGVAASGECTPVAGAPEAGAFCGCGQSGLTRVVAGDPEHSLLVIKLSGSPSCGDMMPPNSEPIAAALQDLVKQWIQAGAKND
jgi:hypothetical protein